jgi:hypothetical protein
VCSRPDCQRQRRREYHRRKRATDADYRQTTRNSQKKWRDAHPDYLRQYRAQHPETVVRNRERQNRSQCGQRQQSGVFSNEQFVPG